MTLKNIFIALLTLALTGSLVVNYFLYKKAFIPLQLSKLDPVGLDYYPPAKATDKQTLAEDVTRIMLYGDSRALSWPTDETPDYQFINRAIGNQTSTQIVQRFEAHAAPHKPQLLLVQMCVNDLKMIPLFPDKQDDIIQDCKDNIQTLISKAQQIDSKVILSTVFPLGDVSIVRKALGTKEAPIVNGIARINNFINAQASDDVMIFDSFKILVGENSQMNPDYSRDWLHLNSDGYKRLNVDLKLFLEQIMPKNPQ